jgi:hypothetical protein
VDEGDRPGEAEMSEEAVRDALEQINKAWLEGRPEAMLPWIHPEIRFVVPGFAGRISGSDALLAGFKDFCENARIVSFQTSDQQEDVVAETAAASYRFEMVYERAGSSYRSTGRDFWVFARREGAWIAVWRTMLDLAEEPT